MRTENLLPGLCVRSSPLIPRGSAVLVRRGGEVAGVIVNLGDPRPPLYTRMCLGVQELERDQRRQRKGRR